VLRFTTVRTLESSSLHECWRRGRLVYNSNEELRHSKGVYQILSPFFSDGHATCSSSCEQASQISQVIHHFAFPWYQRGRHKASKYKNQIRPASNPASYPGLLSSQCPNTQSVKKRKKSLCHPYARNQKWTRKREQQRPREDERTRSMLSSRVWPVGHASGKRPTQKRLSAM
jgi:hypothetical protein